MTPDRLDRRHSYEDESRKATIEDSRTVCGTAPAHNQLICFRSNGMARKE